MNIIEYIDEKIDSVLRYPDAWGGPTTTEPLVLAFLMVRQVASRQDEDDRELHRRYYRARAARRAELKRCSELCVLNMLQDFVEQERSR